jgi:methylthioribulose-1-phosphate dehydratase
VLYQLNSQDLENSKLLATLVRDLNNKGHNPATSGNYSIRSISDAQIALISESGIDKSLFNETHLLPIDIETRKLLPSIESSGRKTSDETDVHLAIYQATKAGCVLHSHMLEALLFAELFPGSNTATIEGLELLKGFSGVTTHEIKIDIPCFNNTQDIRGFSEKIKPELIIHKHNYGLILRGHGIYVWGATIPEAKRHLEVFEYIFKYYLHKNKGI